MPSRRVTDQPGCVAARCRSPVRPGPPAATDWADALNGVDPTLREPMTTAPPEWPLPAAVWRPNYDDAWNGWNEPGGSATPQHPITARRTRGTRLPHDN